MPFTVPVEIGYGRVRARFIKAAADTPADADALPDFIAATGSISFVPEVSGGIAYDSDAMTYVIPDPQVWSLNSAGELDIMLVATDTGNPVNWTYRVTIDVDGLEIAPFSIAVPTNSNLQLKSLLPIGSSEGVLTLRGPAGPTGPTGPAGTQGTPGTGTVNVPELARNLAPNPRVQTGTPTSGGATTTATGGVSVTGHPAGIPTVTETAPVAGYVGTAIMSQTQIDGLGAYATPRFVGAWVRSMVPDSVASIYVNGATTATRKYFPLATGVWTWIATTVPGTGSAIATVTKTGTTDAADTDRAQIGGVMASTRPLATIGSYFDGTMAGCFWTGNANNSASVKGLLDADDSLAVPANDPLTRNLLWVPQPAAGGYYIVQAGSTADLTYVQNAKGAKAVRATRLTSGTSTMYIGRVTDGRAPIPAIAAGKLYRFKGVILSSIDATFNTALNSGTAAGSVTGTSVAYSVKANVPFPFSRIILVPTGFDDTIGSLRIGSADGAANDWFEVSEVQLTEGTADFPYFDGDNQGALWAGTVNNSPSDLYAPRQSDIVAMAAAATKHMEGNGIPEGVVYAEQGTRYIDMAQTNGGLAYIAVSPVTTATGWRCTAGDTGWRVIAPAGTFPALPTLMVLAKRIDNMVHVRTAETTAASTPTATNLWATIPAGFKPDGPTNSGYVAGSVVASNGDPLASSIYCNAQSGVPSVFLRQPVAGQRHYANISWPTNDPWPATLPGTAYVP